MADIDFSKIYSFSKINMFGKCPKQYHFNYLDEEVAKIKKQLLKPRDYTTKGSAVHGAITLFYHFPAVKRTFSNLKNCLEQAWFSEKDIYKKPPLGATGGFFSLNHERRVYRESLELLQNFFKLEKQDPDLFYIPVKNIKNSFQDYEKMIKPLNAKWFVSGKFDRIDKLENNKLKVIDFKTGRNNNDFFQLEFYKMLAEINFNMKVDQVSFYYLLNKEIKSFDVSQTSVNEIKDKVAEKINKIEKTKEFLPNKSRLCSMCDFKEICPAFK